MLTTAEEMLPFLNSIMSTRAPTDATVALPFRWRPYIFLFGLAFALRLIVAIFITQPGYTDAYYYYTVGENIAQGNGAVEPAIWTYIGLNNLPAAMSHAVARPANSYWMPLAEWLVVPGLRIGRFFGITTGTGAYWLASLPFLLLAALITPITFRLALLAFGQDSTGQRRAWLAAILSLFAGRFFIFWNGIDNFAPFAALSSAALLATWEGIRQGRKHDGWLIAAGVLTALAYLSRADAIILVPIIVAFFIWQRRSWTRETAPRWSRLCIGLGIVALTGAGWMIRTYLTFGLITPQSGLAAFLRDYTEVFAYDIPLSFPYYLNQTLPSTQWGMGPLIASKAWGLWSNFYILAIQMPLFLAPLSLIGLFVRPTPRPQIWRAPVAPLWRQPALGGFALFGLLVYLLMALVFTFPSMHGTLFHATGGLVPLQAITMALGIEWLAGLYVARLAKRRRKLLDETRPFVRNVYLTAGVVGVIIAIAGTGILAQATLATWDSDYRFNTELAAWTIRHPTLAGGGVVTGEPLGYYYLTHLPAIPLASESVAANIAAGQRFGATIVVVGPERYPALDSLYASRNTTEQFNGATLRFLEQLPNGAQIYRIVNP